MKRVLGLVALFLVLLLMAPEPTARAYSGPAWPQRLAGVNKSTFEFGCTGTHVGLSDFEAMRAWHINAVRLPLSADEWLNTDGICPTYQSQVKAAVTAANQAGLYVIVTLAWVNPYGVAAAKAAGLNPAGAGYPMPPRAQAEAFWTSVVGQLGYFYHIGYDIFSEPHDVTWPVWHDGGTITTTLKDGRLGGTYDAIGMQELATFVTNLVGYHRVYVPGLSWGGDLSQVNSYPIVTSKNLEYAVHLYPSSNSIPANWPARWGFLGTRVVALEFGQTSSGSLPDCATNMLLPEMQALSATGGMMAWTWNTGSCGRPPLLSSYDGTPSEYGQPVHDYYTSHF